MPLEHLDVPPTSPAVSRPLSPHWETPPEIHAAFRSQSAQAVSSSQSDALSSPEWRTPPKILESRSFQTGLVTGLDANQNMLFLHAVLWSSPCCQEVCPPCGHLPRSRKMLVTMLVCRPDSFGLCGRCGVLTAFTQQQETFHSVQIVHSICRPRCLEQLCTLSGRGPGRVWYAKCACKWETSLQASLS